MHQLLSHRPSLRSSALACDSMAQNRRPRDLRRASPSVLGALGLLICLLSIAGQLPVVSAQEPVPTLPPRPTLEPTLPPRPTLEPTLPPRPTLPPTVPPRPTLEPTQPPSNPEPPPSKPEPPSSNPAPQATPTLQATPSILPISGSSGSPGIASLLAMALGILIVGASRVLRRRSFPDKTNSKTRLH
jgi:outer membrane biosynthesis protein TonB